MGRYTLVSDERKRRFRKYFLPKSLELEEYNNFVDFIAKSIDFATGTYPIYISYFLQEGLKIMFNPLLVDFLHRTKLQIIQVAPNLVRTILGIAKINRRFGMQLNFWDIKYYYGIRY